MSSMSSLISSSSEQTIPSCLNFEKSVDTKIKIFILIIVIKFKFISYMSNKYEL